MDQNDAATFSETQDKVLIRIVKANEWIFNKDKRFTYNEETKANLWLHIRAQLAQAGFNVTDPKARWKQLRDLFVRHDRSGNRKWSYFEDMSFMLHHIRHKVKPPSRNTQLPISLGVGNLGDQASGSRSFFQQRPVLAATTTAPHVENEVRTLNIAEIVGLSTSSCDPLGHSMQQDHSEATLDISEFQLNGHVQPMSKEYEADFDMDFDTQPANDVQMLSSSFTVETSSQNMRWGQTSATLKTLKVNSISSSDNAEDATCQSSSQTESPVCLPTRSFVGVFGRPSPLKTATNLKGNSTVIAPQAETAQNLPYRFSSTTKNSQLPRKGTLISDVQATHSTKKFGEPSRASIHPATRNTFKMGYKRPMVVPALDAFARQKKEGTEQI